MRIVFMGTPDFAVASLDAIVQAGHQVAAVVTVPDRQTGRGLRITYSPVKEYALVHQLPLLQPEKLRERQFLQQLQNLHADLFVVVAFRMLPQVVWSIPPLGSFNLHASLLPNYRGAAPINWALINGEKETGVTTFMLNDHIDEGKILLQRSTPITDADNAESLHERLAEMGKQLVVETIAGLADGTLQPHEQPTLPDPKQAPKIYKDDCAINWDWPGERIVNFVRGLSPYPAATMAMIDEKGNVHSFKVYDVRYDRANNLSKPCIIEKNDYSKINSSQKPLQSPIIPCFDTISLQKKSLKMNIRDGEIEILSLQISGKRKNSSEEFLRGHDIKHWKLV